MRISIDTNVYISYLIRPASEAPPTRIVHSLFEQQFDLYISETLFRKLTNTVRQQSYLSSRVPDQDLEHFIQRLRSAATVSGEVEAVIPGISRDAHDDYLLVHAASEVLDCLVSGDQDLLMLGEFKGVQIVSPTEFVALLRRQA